MSSPGSSRPMGPTVIYYLGGLLLVGLIIKAATGYYESELPLLIVWALAGLALLVGGRKWGERASNGQRSEGR